MKRWQTWLAIGGLLVMSAGCSSFRGDARAARRTPPAPGSLEGLWVGRWYDQKRTEHGGKLEIVLTRTGDTSYRAATRSHWWRLFRSSYDTTLVVTPTAPGRYSIQGGEYLWLWGGFSVTGRVDQTRFEAVYQSLGHRGVMELERPKPGSDPR